MEKFSGIVERITFFSEETGWSVLKVTSLDKSKEIIPVTLFQAKVFAGATLDFYGEWITHAKYGKQFKANKVVEKKPSTIAALEKYLGSGLIKGVGPKTAKRIVSNFGNETLDIFDKNPKRLLEISGISRKKLLGIIDAWSAHKEIRNVMIFLQSHGVSTLYAVKIFKKYGDQSIKIVTENPYKLAQDIYGIGFLSADKIALSIGFDKDHVVRVEAAILEALSNSRQEGHCYLTNEQIYKFVKKLIHITDQEKIDSLLNSLELDNRLVTRKCRDLKKAYYSKTLFFDELYVAKKINNFSLSVLDKDAQKIKITNWLENYNEKQKIPLSTEQLDSVAGIYHDSFSILTGGPGCGKTTTTKTLVELLLAFDKKILLAAPTGRAAQRMGEVIGLSAKTIHRLLIYNPGSGGFKHNEENPLSGDFIILDECSMLDISLTASLFKAIPEKMQVLFIGDKDQLPSVGAGNVLSDLISCEKIPCYKLTQVFRQASESLIIKYAHMINNGITPALDSPINTPEAWTNGVEALLVDSEEATAAQLQFISRVRSIFKEKDWDYENIIIKKETKKSESDIVEVMKKNPETQNVFVENYTHKDFELVADQVFDISKKFNHVNMAEMLNSDSPMLELKSVMKEIHPWSMLHYGLSAKDSLLKIYLESIPRYIGKDKEIQILSPMTRGSMGTHNLNKTIQENKNPATKNNITITIGDKIFRTGDRVIQKKNNYDLEVFNGDIGIISDANLAEGTLIVHYKSGLSEKFVEYSKENLFELDLAYAITIHKSQGSEFDVVIIPILTQHYRMLYRNLIYTALTRAKKYVIFIGMRKALSMAVNNIDNRVRQTMLTELCDMN